MANLPTIETQAKVASDAAQSFVESFYETLNKRLPSPSTSTTSSPPSPLAPFYSTASPLLTASSPSSTPDISINGRALPAGAAAVPAYEALLAAQGSPVRYELGSWDAQPANPDYRPGCPEGILANPRALRDGERMSVAVLVSGTVRYGRDVEAEGSGGAPGADAVVKGFSEAWLLVPHWEAWGRGPPRGARRWVAVSQNFRAL